MSSEEEPPLLEPPVRDLTQRHEEMLAQRRARRIREAEEYPALPPSQPVHRLAYWIVGLAGAAVIGALALAWYLAGAVVMLANAGAEREERLLGIIQEMQTGGDESSISLIAALILILIIAACVVIPIIQALKGN